MSKHSLILSNDFERAKAAKWLSRCPLGWVIEFRERKRTTEQNDYMWALLSDISSQRKHAGMKLSPETWKAVFMHELGIECQFIPSLNGDGVLPVGYRSSKLGVKQMSALIEIILKWGAEKGVEFGNERKAA